MPGRADPTRRGRLGRPGSASRPGTAAIIGRVTAAAPPAEPVRARPRGPGEWLPSLARALFWIVLPIVCLFTVAVGIDRLVSHINHVPSGIRGSFLVTTHNCQQQLCISGGTFTSDDKKLIARNLLGVYRWKLGTKHRVVYNVDAADVIPLPARWDPTAAALGVAGASILLGLWAWCLRGALRRSRRRLVGAGPPSG